MLIYYVGVVKKYNACTEHTDASWFIESSQLSKMACSESTDKLVPLAGAKSKLCACFGFRVDSAGKICDRTKIIAKCAKRILLTLTTRQILIITSRRNTKICKLE